MGGMPPVGLPSASSSNDPAQGTWEGAWRSMRHANSPRQPRLILSPRRFRHTAVSPPPYTSHAHPPLTAGDDRRAKSLHTIVGAILSYLRISRGSSASHHRVRDTAYPDAAPASGL